MPARLRRRVDRHDQCGDQGFQSTCHSRLRVAVRPPRRTAAAAITMVRRIAPAAAPLARRGFRRRRRRTTSGSAGRRRVHGTWRRMCVVRTASNLRDHTFNSTWHVRVDGGRRGHDGTD